jgi:PEP-CTERM motif
MRTALAGAAFAAVVGMSAPAGAVPEEIYYFTGVCLEGCTGDSHGTLVLENYTQGNDISLTTNFVSFSYSSSSMSFTLDPGQVTAITSSVIPASLPATANVSIQYKFAPFSFDSEMDGVWFLGGGDDGRPSSWSLTPPGVPEPATWAMALLGFAGLGFVARRRAKLRGAAGLSAA